VHCTLLLLFVGFAGVLVVVADAVFVFVAFGCAGGGAGAAAATGAGAGDGAGAGCDAESSGPAKTILDAFRSALDLTGVDPWWAKTLEEFRSAWHGLIGPDFIS